MNYSTYNYYRSQLPGWGTSHVQFRGPPPPVFQPRPTWNGFDYYRAHAPNPDHNLYYTVMNRTRDFGPTGGVGMNEARIWQRRVYGGQVNLTQLLPADIGFAAAYEAYRYWKHHNRMLFEPLAGVMEREREALVGLAIAEGKNSSPSALWQLSGRPTDAYGLRDCLESAALTASRIAWQVFDGRASEYDGSPDYRTSSHRRRRRYSTAGTASSPVVIHTDASTGYSGTPYSNPIGIPGRTGSTNSTGYGPNGAPYAPPAAAAMPIPGAGMGSGGSPYAGAGGSPYGVSNMQMHATGTSPYGASVLSSSVPGAGMNTMPVPGGVAGMQNGGGGMGGGVGGMAAAATMYPTTPPMGMGAGLPPPGPPFAGGANVNFPGGYQPAGVAQTAATFAGNAHSPYNSTGGVGHPNVSQPVGYTTSQPGYAGSSSGMPVQGGIPYQQQAVYPDPGMSNFGGGGGGATVVVNGRAIPAPSGSTITVDHKGGRRSRDRRASTSGRHETKHHRRSSSIDPLRYPMVAR